MPKYLFLNVITYFKKKEHLMMLIPFTRQSSDLYKCGSAMSAVRFIYIHTYILERVTAWCAITSGYDWRAILQAMCAKSTLNLTPPSPTILLEGFIC
jgi:hypothetical protein